MHCTFEAITEDNPGARWQELFAKHWPAYSSWFLRSGLSRHPSYLESRRALRQHMPEWVPVWHQLVDGVGGGDIEARFLSLWCPPPYIAGCSQAIWTGEDGPAIIRNYDYAPALLEGTWMASKWGGQRVLALSDCLCGALDGINESGLAASLSFGGRKTVGEGFGIPLVVRYILEFATSTKDAIAMLLRIPVHMTYSVALLDRKGDHAMVYVAPDRPAEVVPLLLATNHQHKVEWQQHGMATHTVSRASVLDCALDTGNNVENIVAAMLAPPLYQISYERGYGTLYTALYRPHDLSAELIWPDHRWRQSIDNFSQGSHRIEWQDPSSPKEE